MIKLDKKLDLFSAPFFKFTVSDNSELNLGLMEFIEGFRSSSDGISASNSEHSWHSNTDFLRYENIYVRTLKKVIIECVAYTVKSINPQIDLSQKSLSLTCWANVNAQSGYNALHDHGDFLLSGCYYVKQPVSNSPKSGAIEFVNTRNDHQLAKAFGTISFEKKLAMIPAPGTMLVFPSTLPHSVYPNSTSDTRITIAWNMRF